MRDTTVTLPEGVQLNPGAANGLQACTRAADRLPRHEREDRDAAVHGRPSRRVPDAAKVGIVHIKTPLLSHELEGAVYLAEPAPNGEAGQEPVRLADRAVPGRRRPGVGRAREARRRRRTRRRHRAGSRRASRTRRSCPSKSCRSTCSAANARRVHPAAVRELRDRSGVHAVVGHRPP